MRLIKTNINKVNNGRYIPGKIQAIVTEFVESDMDCAEVVDHNCKNEYVITCCLKKAIKALKIKGVNAVTRKGHSYIYREEKK